MHDLVTRLLPSMGSRVEDEFNVFDVMRHGGHEKQLSNVFAWLLNSEQTHKLGHAFQKIFIDEVNRGIGDGERVPYSEYSVRQEQNTSESGETKDIADLVLEDHRTTIVIENYYTSSPHGHNHKRYRDFGARGEKSSVVVMLCEVEDRNLMVDGWKGVPIVTYTALLDALIRHVRSDNDYKARHPEQCAFFDHMHRRFGKERKLNDERALEFVDVLCSVGQADRFGHRPIANAAIAFADQLREEAHDRFTEGRDVLARIKQSLNAYARSTLMPHINDALGPSFIDRVDARYAGIYEWTINLHGSDEAGHTRRHAQIKFGPSAWRAVADDSTWEVAAPVSGVDYSHLFLTSGRQIRQSTVRMKDVLGGILADDTRLGDELVKLIRAVPRDEPGPD